jgi:hypothetical protein
MAGHGAAGLITTYNATNGGSWLYLNSTLGSCTGNNACLSSYFFGQLHGIRLMVFHGCDTGSTIASGNSLPKQVKQSLGVDSAIGFDDLIGFSGDTSDVWASYFTEYGISGMSVSHAAWGATNAVLYAYGSYSGYDSLVIYGGSTFIYPAQYGS